jgi:hypothetical protein
MRTEERRPSKTGDTKLKLARRKRRPEPDSARPKNQYGIPSACAVARLSSDEIDSARRSESSDTVGFKSRKRTGDSRKILRAAKIEQGLDAVTGGNGKKELALEKKIGRRYEARIAT